MWEWIKDSEALVYLAGASLVLGYVITNQIVLRLWVSVGTVFYILYYATAAADPLWGAIYMSLAMGAANLIGLGSLLWRRSDWAVPRAHRDIYDQHFSHLPPGDFRALIKSAQRYITEGEETLTTVGTRVPRITFLLSGTATVEKEGERFVMPAGFFFGEVSYVLDQPAAATSCIAAGCEVIVWSRTDLDKLRAHPRNRLAFEAAIARDIARKVSKAVAPASQRIRPVAAPFDATSQSA